MSWILAVDANRWRLIASCALGGLFAGNLICWLSLALPDWLERAWREEGRFVLGLSATEEESQRHASLGRARCPKCGLSLRLIHRLPILGYCTSKGRCASCSEPFFRRALVLELLTAAVSATCALRFEWWGAAAAATLLCCGLILLTTIDLEHQILPDVITIPLLWIGLGLSCNDLFVTPTHSILGAMVGYLSLWVIYQIHRLATGKEGMGHGDFKLLAALGAWLGVQTLPALILVASVTGSAIGIASMVIRRHQRGVPIAFGPYLAAAGYFTLLMGPNDWPRF